VSFEIRPVTEAELALVRSTWRQQWRPRFDDSEPMAHECKHRGHEWGARGGRYVSHGMAKEMFRRYIDEHATVERVLVGAVGGVPCGWVSRARNGVCTVSFVYVYKNGRRAGLGATLLRYVRREAKTAGLEVVPACMNPAGASLWESEKSQ
jgi:GNAT superfamily N-acetyltransferase